MKSLFCTALVFGFLGMVAVSTSAMADQTSLTSACRSYLGAGGSMWTPPQATAFCSCYAESVAKQGALPAAAQQKILNSGFESGGDAAKTLGFQPYCAGCNDEQFSAYNALLDITDKCTAQAMK